MKRLSTLTVLWVVTLVAALCGQRGQARGGGLGVGVGAGAGVGVGVGTGPGIPRAGVGVGGQGRGRAGIQAGPAEVDLSARENARLRADTMMRRPPTAALAANSHLSTRLQTLLPAGQTVESAATGFKNLGQLVAATHASHNLNIPFDQLKVRMTGSEGRTLGQAIHELRPDVNAKAEEKKAMKQARADIEAHGETTAQHETRR